MVEIEKMTPKRNIFPQKNAHKDAWRDEETHLRLSWCPVLPVAGVAGVGGDGDEGGDGGVCG